MKVLFLDIDGVLNNESTKERISIAGRPMFDGFIGLDARLVGLLKDWLATHPDVKVVLSSTWRLEPEMVELILAAGIPIVSVTSNLGQRQKEILNWLEQNPEVESFAILDDIQHFSANVRHHFVQTSYVHGLRAKNLKKLSEILGHEKLQPSPPPAQGAGDLLLSGMDCPAEE